jgi:hypothetical protein
MKTKYLVTQRANFWLVWKYSILFLCTRIRKKLFKLLMGKNNLMQSYILFACGVKLRQETHQTLYFFFFNLLNRVTKWRWDSDWVISFPWSHQINWLGHLGSREGSQVKKKKIRKRGQNEVDSETHVHSLKAPYTISPSPLMEAQFLEGSWEYVLVPRQNSRT